MKMFIYILLYIGLTLLYYVVLCLIGATFSGSFLTIYKNIPWFTIYLMFIHWWLVIPSLSEYWEKYIVEKKNTGYRIVNQPPNLKRVVKDNTDEYWYDDIY